MIKPSIKEPFKIYLYINYIICNIKKNILLTVFWYLFNSKLVF